MEISQFSTDYDELIGTIYQGPLEAVPFQSFMEMFRKAMKSLSVSLVLRPPTHEDTGVLLNQGGSVEWENAYKDQFFALDPFVDLPEGNVVVLQEFMPEEELLKSPYYKQYMKPAGVFYLMGVDTSEPNGLQARLRISRTRDDRKFSDVEKALCARIVPHLHRAIQIHSRLTNIESERNIYAGAVEQLSMGTIILDENGKILRTNQLASDLINDKSAIKDIDGNLHLSNRDETNKLRELIEEVQNDHTENHPFTMAKALRIENPITGQTLGLLVRAVPAMEWSEGVETPSIAIFISDPEQNSIAPLQIVQQLFGFTRAEASLATLLAKGLALDEASAELGITRNTARAQLRSVFSKAGVTRQADLVRLILKSVASLG